MTEENITNRIIYGITLRKYVKDRECLPVFYHIIKYKL